MFVESVDLRPIKHIPAALNRTPRSPYSVPGVHSDQLAMITFIEQRNGTGSAYSTMFNEQTEFFSEKADELQSILHWHTRRKNDGRW